MYNFINNMNTKSNYQNNTRFKSLNLNVNRHNTNTLNTNTLNTNTLNTNTLNTNSFKTVSLFSQPYLDQYNQCYKNIVTINLPPQGPLADLVRKVNFPKLSPFKQDTACSPIKQCGLALVSLGGYFNSGCKNGNDLMVVDEIPNLISILISNGYTVDTSITKMFYQSDIQFDTNTGNKLICMVTYNG